MNRCWIVDGSPLRKAGLLGVLLPALLVSTSTAQDGGDPAPAGKTVESPSEPPAGESPPSLDDLLDIEESTADGNDDAAIAESDRRSLDAALAEQKPTEAFRSAIDDMLVSSELLEVRQDTGLGTQRLQQRIVDRLQALIDSAARQQQQQQQQQSSSSSSQQQDPGRREEEQNQQQQQQQQQQRNQDGPQDGSSDQPPPPESADLEGALDGAGIEWGGLPPRMRELISQGTRDRVSEMYRSLTEAYYRRMAEEGGR
ncbi:MAG: hypothetical protein GY895_23180 [Phycisphaera sp.]|nr:hypothetical protein [Phycisphaera sp.]